MSQASELISQQFKDGNVIPSKLSGQDSASKTYVDEQLAIRDGNIAAAAGAASAAQADIDQHEASTVAHPAQHITYAGDVTGASDVKQGLDKVYQRVNQIIAGGDSSAEVVDARGSYSVLGDRLNASDAQLADKSQLTNKRAYLYANVSDTERPLEIHNKAGQGTGSDQSSFVIHHYTDAVAETIDNVGTGNVLVLRNANNPATRLDKPADFVGSGKYISAAKYNPTLGIYEEAMYIGVDGNIYKTGVGGASEGTLAIIQKKEDAGTWGIRFRNDFKHANPFTFYNGGNFVFLLCDTSGTRAVFASDAVMTGGMEVRSNAGDLTLRALSGIVKVHVNNNYQPVQAVLNNWSNYRPANQPVGTMSFDTTLGKPIWLKTLNDGYSTTTARANSTAYSVGGLILVSGRVYRCSTAGTSAVSAPTFPTALNATVTDGTVVWTCMGVASVWVDATGTTV